MTVKLNIDPAFYDAFIFDMDGLLIDTERICWECFIEACGKYGYNPEFGIYKNCIGRKVEEGDLILEEGFRDMIPYGSVKSEWNMLYRNRVENGYIPLKPGVKEFLEILSGHSKKISVATSTVYELARKKLEKTGISVYFDYVVSGDMVKNSKPDPEIYLKAAEMLRTEPGRCIAFEDSDNGVRSAFSAGINVVQVIDLLEPSPEIVKFGHVIVGSFNEIGIK